MDSVIAELKERHKKQSSSPVKLSGGKNEVIHVYICSECRSKKQEAPQVEAQSTTWWPSWFQW